MFKNNKITNNKRKKKQHASGVYWLVTITDKGRVINVRGWRVEGDSDVKHDNISDVTTKQFLRL